MDPCTCRFDAAAWTQGDLTGTLPHLRSMAAHLAEGASYDVAVRLAEVLAPLERPDGDLLDTVHQAWHLLSDAGRLRHALGEGAPPQHGVVAQVSVSAGGVPKQPVLRAAVTSRGVSGDRQATRKHHGRPWQAVCLWSAEVVDALAADGHPIAYGSAGENLTVRGLDWATVRPGVRLLLGSALVETTAYAIPCQKNAQWFSDRRFRRMAHEVSPGTSRVYARVLVDGVVAPGDPVLVEPGVEPLTLPAQARPAEQGALF